MPEAEHKLNSIWMNTQLGFILRLDSQFDIGIYTWPRMKYFFIQTQKYFVKVTHIVTVPYCLGKKLLLFTYSCPEVLLLRCSGCKLGHCLLWCCTGLLNVDLHFPTTILYPFPCSLRYCTSNELRFKAKAFEKKPNIMACFCQLISSNLKFRNYWPIRAAGILPNILQEAHIQSRMLASKDKTNTQIPLNITCG